MNLENGIRMAALCAVARLEYKRASYARMGWQERMKSDAFDQSVAAFRDNPSLIIKAIFWDAPWPPDLDLADLIIECERRILDERELPANAYWHRPDPMKLFRLEQAHAALCAIAVS